jgi:hypothetical protein
VVEAIYFALTDAEASVPGRRGERVPPKCGSQIDEIGHAHLDTTNHYAQANLDTKREALERLDPSAKIDKPPRWRRDASVLAWLDSL